jgi:hypothetical protein
VITPAVNYLERNYNATIGLVHESPDSSTFRNTYWVYSDNFLAQIALATYDPKNVTLVNISQNISRTIAHYTYGQPDLVNQYLVLATSLFPFNATKNFILASTNGATIKTTINNQTGKLDPRSYADIAFLEAIAYHKKGEDQNALTVYHEGLVTWDGFGFKDNAFNGTYATYKDALYILASKILNQPYNPDAFQNLLNSQLVNGVDNGGFATSYTGNGTAASGSNTETTSLAILALSYPEPSVSPTSTQPLTLVLVTAAGLPASLFLIVVILKRRKIKNNGSALTWWLFPYVERDFFYSFRIPKSPAMPRGRNRLLDTKNDKEALSNLCPRCGVPGCGPT